MVKVLLLRGGIFLTKIPTLDRYTHTINQSSVLKELFKKSFKLLIQSVCNYLHKIKNRT